MTNWQAKKLGDIATIKRGGSPRPIQEYLVNNSDEGYSWLKIGDVPMGSRYIYKTSSKIKPSGLNKTTLVKKGEFILSNSMSFGRPYIMMTDACIHDGWLALQDISDDTDKQFLYYLLTSEQMQNKFKNFSAGSGVLNLKKETVKAINFKAPEKPEQERIVAVLEVWDEYIEKLEQKIALKEQLKKGLMQQLLTGKRRLPGFGGQWQEVKLGDITTFVNGYAFQSSTYSDEGNYRVITIANVQNGNLDYSSAKTINNLPDSITYEQTLKRGDVLISMTGNVGRTCRVNIDNGLLNQRVGKFLARPGVNIDFLYHTLQLSCFIVRMVEQAQGGAQDNLSSKDIKNYQIYLPSDDEQRAISKVVDTIDLEIKNLKDKKINVVNQKKYLLKNLITGTIRTPEDLQPPTKETK